MRGPSNILIQHNTIASIGNTNAIAFQAATSGYDNIQIIDNYLSGFGYLVALGTGGGQQFSNSSFTNNVFGTDLNRSSPHLQRLHQGVPGQWEHLVGQYAERAGGLRTANGSNFTFHDGAERELRLA